MPEPGVGHEAGRPLVTVVIAARDAADDLGPTIETALAQTHRPLEVVVVDDGSTDATAEIARAFGAPVRVVEQPPAGAAAACNTGFAAARGSVVALLGVGDRWDPTLVARCVDRLQADPRTGLVTTDCFRLDGAAPTDTRGYDATQGRGLWLRGAHGRPQDAYAIARRVAARGERRLALWFVAHSLVDAGANPAERLRFAFGGAWLVLTARRPRELAPAAQP